MWRALPDGGEVKTSWNERFETAREASARHHAEWEEALAAWRLVKAQRVADSGLPTDPVERRALQLNPVCWCDHCVGGEEEEEGGKEAAAKVVGGE